jgi:hypothetical protein
LKFWQWTKAGSLWFAGAAARSGQQGKGGSDEGGKNTDHGDEFSRFYVDLSEFPEMFEAGGLKCPNLHPEERIEKNLLAGIDVGWCARGWWCGRRTGSGEQGS